MGWVDRIPRAGNLYIGGLHALFQKPDLFKEAQITHILSILDYDLYEAGHFKEYKHLQIRLDDDPNENILQHFEETNRFLDSALQDGGAVFVHCAMGKSRSATLVCAYLMHKYGVTPFQALQQVCEGRPVCSPNPGFMEQLEVYHNVLRSKDSTKSKSIYQEWLKGRFTGDWWTWDRRRRASKL